MGKREKYLNRITCNIYVVLIIVATTGICSILAHAGIESESLIMVYLIGVLLSTVVTKGYVYGFVTAAWSLLCYNYYFTFPYFTMRIYYKRDMVMMCFFFVTAVIGGGMASKYKIQSQIAKENERTTRLMYAITESFAALAGVDEITRTAEKFISDITGYACEVDISRQSRDEITDSGKYSLDIIGNTKLFGTITIDAEVSKISPDVDKIIKAVANQTALVLDRESIYTEREKYKLDMETERLKGTLLRSISHDIRTPLTGILGASTAIVENSGAISKDDMVGLVKGIMEETEWLIMTVQNILNLTRLSDGAFDLRKEIESVDDLISQAIMRISRIYPNESIILSSEMPEKLIFVNVDGQLFVQVLVNLLDNAFKHSEGAGKVTLRAYEDENNVVFEVSDDGKGIDEGILDNVFDGFVTLSSHSSDKGRGIGLGLSICREIVKAHGGTVEAENAPKGAVFRVKLPGEVL